MGISMKDIFSKDEEQLVENKRKTAIKNMTILASIVVVLIIIALVFKYGKNIDEDRRIAITRDVQNIQTAIKNYAVEHDVSEYPGKPLDEEGVMLNINGVQEEYRYGYYLLMPEDLKLVAAALNLPDEVYAVNYETGDVVNSDGIKFNKRRYHSVDDLVAIDAGQTPLSDRVQIISTPADMQKMRKTPNGYFKLSANIDMTEYSAGEGWEPIPNFTGILDGRGYTISNLTIDAPVKNYVGLFGDVKSTARITNLKLDNVNVVGGEYTGSLAGHCSGLISYVHILSGTVTGNDSSAGGLVGAYSIGKINNCTVKVNVDGDEAVGGIVGTLHSGTLDKVSAEGTVTGITSAGGLAGVARVSNATYIYENAARVAINGKTNLGGLIGAIELTADQKNIIVANSYATGSIQTGESNLGGMFGKVNTIQGTPSITFEKLYANMSVVVKGPTSGGCIGSCAIGTSTTRNVTNCYWAKELNPGEELNDIGQVTQGSTLSFEPRRLVEMQMLSNYSTWDFTKLWDIEERVSLPTLKWEKNYIVEVEDGKK